jgi:hypothetical protein
MFWNMWPVKYHVRSMESCRYEIGGGGVFTTTVGGFLAVTANGSGLTEGTAEDISVLVSAYCAA